MQLRLTIVGNLNGKKVITKDLVDVGEISGAVMDDSWRITYLLLALNKDTCHKLEFVQPLGGHITLCLPVQLIKKVNDHVSLDKNFEEIKVLPFCKTK